MRGAALIDVVFTCGLVALISMIAIPSLRVARDRDAARMAAQHLAARLHAVRLEALRRNRAVAIRFDPDALGRMASYVDGDGDGVQQSDIDRGVDTRIGEERALSDDFGLVALRVASTVPAPDGGSAIAADSDPVRIGNTDLLSFSPLGSATSGTIYLAARTGPQVCVRVLGATGRVRVMWFDTASRTWRTD